jgi:hypothetical protein
MKIRSVLLLAVLVVFSLILSFQSSYSQEYNSSTSFPAPYGHYWETARHQMLFRASELLDEGYIAGNLNSMVLHVASMNNIGSIENISIKMKLTTANVLSAWDYAGLTEVYNHPDYYYPIVGYNEHQFSTPFYWDGISNILVDFCFNGGWPYTFNASTYYTNVGWNACIYSYDDGNPNMCIANGPTSTNISQLRPDIFFGLSSLTPPSLISPANNSSNVDHNVTFFWNTVTGATQYKIQVSTTSSFSTTVEDTITTDQFWSTGLEPVTIYYWRVKALNSISSGPWSDTWNFQTAFVLSPCSGWVPPTNNNSTIIVPDSINIQINGRPIGDGDAIGLFYERTPFVWVCAGFGCWNGSSMNITVWGDDITTTLKEGYSVGEQYTYRIWDNQLGIEVPANVTYQSGPDNYQIDGFSILSSLTTSHSIMGAITYNNTEATPLSNCTLLLKDSAGTLIAQASTGYNGSYEISAVPPGTYHFEISTNKAWGGLNVLDIILTRLKIAFLTEFTPLQTKAADVNLSNTINIFDAILMRQKIAFLNPPEWIIPAYVFENPVITVSGSDPVVYVNIKALCAGDVDGSFVPPE